MDTLPRELLAAITRQLFLSEAARLAQSSKKNNQLIWTFVTQLTYPKETNNISTHTNLSKFNNLTSLQVAVGSLLPRELGDLTNLKDLGTIDLRSPAITTLQKLTNLRSLSVYYKNKKAYRGSIEDLLNQNTKLVSFSLTAFGLDRHDPLSWKFLTRIQQLKLIELADRYLNNNIGLSKLWTFTQLRMLSLESIEQGAGILETGSDGLSKLLNLESLSITRSKSQSSRKLSWTVDYTALPLLPKLTYLSIMKVNHDEVSHQIFARMTQLVHFELLQTIEDPTGLQFLHNLHYLDNLTIAADHIPAKCALNLSGLTRLTYLKICWQNRVDSLTDFYRCLTAVQSLRKISSSCVVKSDLLALAQLTQLRVLEVPAYARQILIDRSQYPFDIELV